MSKDLFDKDSRFEKLVNFHEDAIHIKKLLQILSLKIGVKFYNDPQYYRDYVFIRIKDVECKDFLGAIANLYGTYWEKTSLGYALRRMSHGEEDTLALTRPGTRKIAEALSKARETFEKMPSDVRRSLAFEENQNSRAMLDSLPSTLNADLKVGINAIREMQYSTFSPSVKRIFDDSKDIQIGFRITTSEKDSADRIEFQYFKGNSFYASSTRDTYGQIKARKKGFDVNNSVTKSYKIDMLSVSEIKKLKEKDESLNTLITLNLPKMFPSLMVKLISVQVPEQDFICTAKEDIKYPGFQKIGLKVFREPLHKTLDYLCRDYKYLVWDLRKSKIIVLRDKYFD